jgi:hypothetical protein
MNEFGYLAHLDADGYPTDYALDKIANWCYTDVVGLMDFIKPIWMFAEQGYWHQTGNEYSVSTGGWSGNEDIIRALQKNWLFWSTCWVQSRRGGHYIFEVKE